MKPAEFTRAKHIFIAVLLLQASAAPVWGQLTFEVASVKPSRPPGAGRSSGYAMRGGPGTPDPARFICENFDLASLIMFAYDIPRYKLSAPAWTHEAKFDVVANVPIGATKEQFHLMLQNLLTERFQLKIHMDTKEVPVYALLVARSRPKLKERSEATPMTKVASTGREVQMTFTSANMERLALQISTLPEAGRPVLDLTGLTGSYDFQLNLPGADSDSGAPSLFTVIQEQLGLKLESRVAPVTTLVVDYAERVPKD
jgi:uncharacterized protein (TIGR03435 family)